jgi:hypothetical protein
LRLLQAVPKIRRALRMGEAVPEPGDMVGERAAVRECDENSRTNSPVAIIPLARE